VLEGFERPSRVDLELERAALALVLDRDEDAIRPRVPEQPNFESIIRTAI
jgi:hypothetical protein